MMPNASPTAKIPMTDDDKNTKERTHSPNSVVDNTAATKPTPSAKKSGTGANAQGVSKSNKPRTRSKATTAPQATPNPTLEGVGGTIADILDTDYRGISLYTVAMLLLTIAILWTGIKTAQQIQEYHHVYGQMTKLKKDFRQLQIERQRMLIEQQTFSGTPQVTNRAVTQLNMFYPNLSDRMIIHANTVVAPPTGNTVPNLSSTPQAPEVSKASSVNSPIDPQSQH